MSVRIEGGCERCGRLPVVAQPSRLHVWLPISHSFRKLDGELRAAGIPIVEQDEAADHLAIELGSAEATSRANLIRAILSGEELDGGRGLLLDDGEVLSTKHLPRVCPLRVALGRLGAGWLTDILKEGRLETWFQPIVDCRSGSEIHGFECLMRAREPDGALILPGPMMSTARDADLTYQLDLAARRRAVRDAAGAGIDGRVFINFSPAAIYDPEFCLRSTVSLIERVGLRPEQVVFEIIEADRPQDVNHLRGIVAFYQSRGFQVALDDMGAGYSSLNLVHLLRPDYIKLDRDLVNGVARNTVKQEIAGALLDMACRLKIGTIAEGIEREEDHAWAAARKASYAQGFLFGRPAPKPEVAAVTRAAKHSGER